MRGEMLCQTLCECACELFLCERDALTQCSTFIRLRSCALNVSRRTAHRLDKEHFQLGHTKVLGSVERNLAEAEPLLAPCRLRHGRRHLTLDHKR